MDKETTLIGFALVDIHVKYIRGPIVLSITQAKDNIFLDEQQVIALVEFLKSLEFVQQSISAKTEQELDDGQRP